MGIWQHVKAFRFKNVILVTASLVVTFLEALEHLEVNQVFHEDSFLKELPYRV